MPKASGFLRPSPDVPTLEDVGSTGNHSYDNSSKHMLPAPEVRRG